MAEELVFGEPSTGPGSDLEQASGLARKMVLEYGMSETLGPVALGKAEPTELLPNGAAYSEQTAAAVDAEVRRLVREAEQRARQILLQYREELDRLTTELEEREVLLRADVDRVLGPPAREGVAAERPSALDDTSPDGSGAAVPSGCAAAEPR